MALTRRLILAFGAALGALPRWRSRARAQPDEPSRGLERFPNGIASGDPLARSVMLWTRAIPQRSGADVARVEWWVAAAGAGTDGRPGDQELVASGFVETNRDRDWTVKVDAGGLEPDTWYDYGFRFESSDSPVGRTRTLPTGRADSLAIAVFSCSNHPFGYFHSYRNAAARDDLDLAIHLGDYIYEYGPDGYGGPTGERLGREHQPPHEIFTLEDYRTRYAQYRSDPDLQAIHAALPMIAVWDDHEITNNAWHSGAENHQEESEGIFAERRAAAVRAWGEWMPSRTRPGSRSDRIYRAFEWGDLASILMLDTRLIGRDQQLDYGDEPSTYDEATVSRWKRDRLDAPQRTMLGAEQEAWLKAELARSQARDVPWQVLGQQLLIGGLKTPDFTGGTESGTPNSTESENPEDSRARRLRGMFEHQLPLNLDAWDGYGAARERLAQDCLAFGNNVVALAGDTHNSWAFDLLDRQGRQFGVEFGGSSVTSPGLERAFPETPPSEVGTLLQATNPHLRYVDTHQRGYMIVRFSRDRASAEWLYVDHVEEQTASEHTAARAVVRRSETAGTPPLEIERLA